MEEIKKIRKGMAKANKGITLIALVITIIILIILAGVAVNLSLGENGIFNRAKTAREQYKMAEVKEKIELAIVDIQSEKISKGEQCTIDTIISELPGKVEGLTISKDGENAKGKYNDCDFKIDPSLKVTIEGYTPSTGSGTSGSTSGGTGGSTGGSTGGDTGGSSTPTTILVDSITLNKTSLTLMESKEETLTTTIHPTNATNKEVTWSTNADSIATVDTTGKVKAVATGTAIITATAKDGSGKSASCTVKVTEKTSAEYVNYPIDLNKNGDTTDDWMLFYKADGNAEGEETGGAYYENIGDYYLIAAEFLKNKDDGFDYGKIGASIIGKRRLYWESTSSVIKNQYLQTTGESEISITRNSTDTTTTINKLFMQNKYKITRYFENSKVVSALIKTDYWKGYVDSQYADYAIGSPTAEMWVASWNAKYGTEMKLYINTDIHGYFIGKTSTIENNTELYLDEIWNKYKPTDLLGYRDQDDDNLSGIWMASPNKDADSFLYTILNTGVSAKLLYASSRDNRQSIRPVVHLKSGTTLEKNASGIWEIK